MDALAAGHDANRVFAWSAACKSVVGHRLASPNNVVNNFLDKVPVWAKLVVNPTKWGQAIAAAGGKVDTFELPRMGIKGNTHMMMMDRNSDDVAKLINDWIEKQGLAN